METTDEIINGNDLIAQYLGIEKSAIPHFYHTPKGFMVLEYHNNLNWLMPVILKFCDEHFATLTYHNGKYTIKTASKTFSDKVVVDNTTDNSVYILWLVFLNALQHTTKLKPTTNGN